MANSHMTFGVDLLPKTNAQYSLGNSDQKWKIYVDTVNGQTLGALAFKNSLSVVDIPTLTGYKTVQSAIQAPTAETNKWVSSIGQDTNGKITVSYSSLSADGSALTNNFVKRLMGEAILLKVYDSITLNGDAGNITGLFIFNTPETYPASGTFGEIFLIKPDNSNILHNPHFCFQQYSFSSSSQKALSYYDRFFLPITSADKTSNNEYYILTTKTTTSIGASNNPVFFNANGQPEACGDATSTSLKSLETISAAGSIGFYSNGNEAIGLKVTTKDNVTSYPIRANSATEGGLQFTVYKPINFRSSFFIWPETSKANIGDIIFYRSSGSTTSNGTTQTWGSGTFGRILYEGPYSEDKGNDDVTNYTTNRFAFRQYSYSNSKANSYYDVFRFPSTSGNTANYGYTILTTKQTVTIEQGGTGATTADAARTNLGTWALVNDTFNTLMQADGTTNGWVKIGTANDSYGILPSQQGSWGTGHNYLGTSSWYWKAAYINTVYGDLNGNAATATKLSDTPNNTTTFLRGDNTWSNTLTNTLRAVTLETINTTTNGAQIGFLFSDRSNSTYGLIWASRAANKGGRLTFGQYSESSNGTLLSYREQYSLPIPTAGLTATKYYDILTTKDMSFSITGNAATATEANALANLYDNSSRPTDANITHVTNGGITHFKATSSMTSNKPEGAYGDGSILHFHWDSSDAWDSQLFIPVNDEDHMQYRAKVTKSTWESWQTLLDSTNYSSYALPLTGGTLSGQLYMATSSGVVYPSGAPTFYFLRGNNSTVSNRMGAIFCNYGTTNSITRCDRIYLRHYSYNSSTGAAINDWDQYCLPAATPDLTASHTYNILTTKDMSFDITGNAATATNSDKLDNLDSLDFLRNYHSNAAVGNIDALNTISYFYAHGDEGGFASGTNPGGNNGTAILHAHTHSGNYYTQLALDTARNALWVRSCNNATTFSNWLQVVTNSGSWNINVTGNAATATKANALANLYDSSSRPTDANIAHVTNGGVVHFKATSAMTSNSPGDGNILHFHWDSSSAWDSQLFVPDGTGSHMRYRGHSSASAWYDWRTLLDSANYSSYVVPLSGGTMTGTLTTKRTTTGKFIDFLQNTLSCGCLRLNTLGTTSAEGWTELLLGNNSKSNVANNASGRVYLANSNGTWIAITAMYGTLAGATRSYININNWFNATGVTGAVWNDYAEFRKTNKEAKAGQAVIDNDDGSLSITDKRLMPGAQIVSDTFGFSIGETEEAKTPLAVSGRVLVYTYRPREEYHAGMAVCSAPNGTIDIMTREEIQQYPDAIIGIVSEIPEYEEWGTGKVKVNGRIWIKIK